MRWGCFQRPVAGLLVLHGNYSSSLPFDTLLLDRSADYLKAPASGDATVALTGSSDYR